MMKAAMRFLVLISKTRRVSSSVPHSLSNPLAFALGIISSMCAFVRIGISLPLMDILRPVGAVVYDAEIYLLFLLIDCLVPTHLFAHPKECLPCPLPASLMPMCRNKVLQ